MADVLFNPKWEPQLKILREAPPQSERAKKVLANLFAAAKAAPQAAQQEQQ
jgi:hypothetical protein